MSSDKTETRSRTWHFSHTLYTSVKPDAAHGLCPTSSIGPWDLIKRKLDELFRDGPQSVFYIHLPVSRAAFDHCIACGRSGTALPNLPFTGFIQASGDASSCALRSMLVCGVIHGLLVPRQWTPSWWDFRYYNAVRLSSFGAAVLLQVSGIFLACFC